MTGVRGPAATGLGKQLRAAQARLVVPFEDNRHLNRLLGEYDGHLALLEERLGIEAQAHGNVVTLTGASAACDTAREVLEKLYARIRQGEDMGRPSLLTVDIGNSGGLRVSGRAVAID